MHMYLLYMISQLGLALMSRKRAAPMQPGGHALEAQVCHENLGPAVASKRHLHFQRAEVLGTKHVCSLGASCRVCCDGGS